MSDGLDPEIAALLSQSDSGAAADDTAVETTNAFSFDSPSSSSSASSSPSFSGSNKSIHEVDLSRTEFAPIEKFTNDRPSEVYQSSLPEAA